MDDLCPDCKHPVSDHDMFGCTRFNCGRWPKENCTLTGEFLLEYFADTK